MVKFHNRTRTGVTVDQVLRHQQMAAVHDGPWCQALGNGARFVQLRAILGAQTSSLVDQKNGEPG